MLKKTDAEIKDSRLTNGVFYMAFWPVCDLHTNSRAGKLQQSQKISHDLSKHL